MEKSAYEEQSSRQKDATQARAQNTWPLEKTSADLARQPCQGLPSFGKDLRLGLRIRLRRSRPIVLQRDSYGEAHAACRLEANAAADICRLMTLPAWA